MYRFLGDDLSGLGDDLSGCCSGCSGLAGMGLTLPTPTGEATQSEPWWQRAIEEAERIAGKIVSPVPRLPTYTPPTLPPYRTEQTYAEPQATNWTPYLIGGALLLALTMGGRR